MTLDVQFQPFWVNADICPSCHRRGMPAWQATSTGRKCAACGFVEDRECSLDIEVEKPKERGKVS